MAAEVMTTVKAGSLRRVPASETRELPEVLRVVGGTAWQLVGN